MAEYIDREMSLKTIDEYFHITNPDGEEQIGVLKSRKIIRTLPAADVAPVRHGRWDNIPNTYMCVAGKDGSYHGCATSCSVCHEINPNAYKTKYCPNCGARMDLELVYPG